MTSHPIPEILPNKMVALSASATSGHLDLGLHLHHVGYVVADIPKIAAAYVKSLSYEIITPILHDQQQTAFVQFLKLAGDLAYLEFVAPDSPESVLASSARRRPGLNHLCYTSGPHHLVIPEAEQRGLRLISKSKPGLAFGGRNICWLMGIDPTPIELVERRHPGDLCEPGHV